MASWVHHQKVKGLCWNHAVFFAALGHAKTRPNRQRMDSPGARPPIAFCFRTLGTLGPGGPFRRPGAPHLGAAALRWGAGPNGGRRSRVFARGRTRDRGADPETAFREAVFRERNFICPGMKQFQRKAELRFDAPAKNTRPMRTRTTERPEKRKWGQNHPP